MSRDLLSVTRLLGPGTEAAQLREALRDVIDPELGIDILSLGLVYGLEVHDRVAAVILTTTTPACPGTGRTAGPTLIMVRGHLDNGSESF